MKLHYSVCVLFVLLLSNYFSYSQDNISLFAEEGTEWSVGDFEPNPSLPKKMYFIKMIGDTVIDDLQYHILRMSDYFFSETNPGEIAAFVRITEYDVLFFRNLSGEEYKVFDYSLENYENASLSAYIGENFTVEVCSYSTVTYFGQSRKRWSICGVDPDNNGGEIWVEGVGPLSGILWANQGLLGLCGFYPQLLCASLNGVQIYQNPDHNFCEYFVPSFLDRFNFVGDTGSTWDVAVSMADDNYLYTDSVFINAVTLDSPSSWYYLFYYYVINAVVYNPTEFSYLSDYFYAKVFSDSLLYVKNRENAEHIVFDFKAQKDDTLDLWSYDFYTDTFYPVTAWIENTDSVLTSHGMRKSWRLTNEYGSTLWMKGLGNDEGLLRMNFALTGIDTTETVLICAHYENTQIYQNPDFDFCSYNSLIQSMDENKPDIHGISIFPNPTYDNITVKSENPGFFMQIYDITGNELLRKTYIDREITVDLSSYSAGVYFINIISSGKNYSEKIIRY